MVPTGRVGHGTSVVEGLQQVEPRLSALGRTELREILLPIETRLREGVPAAEVSQAIDSSLALCRTLYARARSGDALPLARAILAQAIASKDPLLMRRAASACGLLAADTGDVVAGIEHHVHALRIAASLDDQGEMARCWNNMGVAMGIGANYEMASRCYERAVDLLQPSPEPLHTRYAAYTNLADTYFQTGNFEAGLSVAHKALFEETPEMRERDPWGALALRRNAVRLMAAMGRYDEAAPHAADCAALADRVNTARAVVAAATTRAIYELGTGRIDLALTRLDEALSRAREVPAALRYTLAIVVEAEEAAGNIERALMRLRELSDHIYNDAIARAAEHLESAGFRLLPDARVQGPEQESARLSEKVAQPHAPEDWGALRRLAAGAVMRVDRTGFHGVRVGTLTKALAAASGCGPLQALEIGLAAEVHDVGMMSVPEGVLRKPGPLNDAERSIVARHVEAGARILRDDRHPRVGIAREIARFHHARWDGEGHPARVGGGMIPASARMCAVADAYDAMVCGIGSRAPKAMDAALAELRREAGRQFDPELVDRFDALIRSETEELGMDLNENNGMPDFQALIESLQQDRGFV